MPWLNVTQRRVTNPMRVFVAGHQGLVGSALLRKIPDRFEVVTTARSELDLENFKAVHRFLRENQIDGVVLAAAYVGGIGVNSKKQSDFLLRNLKIQNSVIEAAALCEIPKMIFLGSSCVYPKLAPQPISENSLLTSKLEPTNEGYAIAKIAGMRLCQALFEEKSLHYISLMPSNLYGPNDNYNLATSHVPAALMRKFHEAKMSGASKVVVWGSGTPRREFLHVDDLADACWFFIEKDLGGELINIGSGEDISILDFAKLMARIVGYEGEIVFDTKLPDGTPKKLLNVNKALSLGWKYEIELEIGLTRTYMWFLEALAKGEIRGY
jgi:GDP-L-fucose synthase